jgi:phytoene dehydrogenase-like protein
VKIFNQSLPSLLLMSHVIVVGGGLSGLSAAHTIYLSGGNVLVLDKQGEWW